MEDENQFIRSESATCTTTEEQLNSSPADDPPPPSATTDSGDEPKNKNENENDREEPDTARESKRRKLCPSALEKFESIIMNSCSNSSNGFSFTFDPKFSCGVSTPEVTPKFGSFNLVAEAEAEAAAGSREEIEVKSEREYELKKEEEEEDEEIKEKRKFLEVFGGSSDDGISADYFEEGLNLFL